MLKLISTPRPALLYLLLCAAFSADAQRFQSSINAYLQKEKTQWQLTDSDIAHYAVTDQYDNTESGITYTYLHQQVNGIRIFNAVSSMAIRDGKVVHFANRFHPNAVKSVNALQPTISPEEAITNVVQYLGLNVTDVPRQLNKEADRIRYTYNDAGIARENIRVELVYVPIQDELKLAWNVNLAPTGSADWWNIRIDAQSGRVLEKNNWTTYCDFGTPHMHNSTESSCTHEQISMRISGAGLNAPPRYNIYPIPVESPDFGDRLVVVDPHLPEASPFGWHDDNGIEGADYTMTRGNNVYVYEDILDFNFPGYSPDGGPDLNFDFPLDLALPPLDNIDASLTNLFYMNNMIHDILYVHGFDEAAGNFQATNYTGEGLGNDFVLAEGLDGGGTDNANFSTPEDGQNGRMQMYLWLSERTEKSTSMEIHQPDSMTGSYLAVEASFGPGFGTPVTGQVAMVVDGVDPVTNACDSILNVDDLAGKIAIIDGGGCQFIAKARNAEEAGAIAVVIINTNNAPPFVMGGNGSISIPAVMISKADGERLKSALTAGDTIEITLFTQYYHPDRDCSLDNGIIAHEYGHGLSNRLTGGPANSSCLNHAEQGGEGWSDWLSMILTIEPDDQGSDAREIGVYAENNVTSSGIRRYPYSTDMAVNPQTYGDLASSFGPHARGEILCSALWDVTWALIDAEGFDPDLFGGNGGNNIAMRLVIEGMKLHGCNPSYLDVRDGILKADALLYDSTYRCIIWEAFAKRGFGYNAEDGSAFVAGDETEDFLISNLCLTATVPPTAKFEADDNIDCNGIFSFRDMSTDIPQYYAWDFGDGFTSVERNPVHVYANPGEYVVTLVVTNNVGSDTFAFEVFYGDLPIPSVISNVVICEGSTATLAADVIPGYNAVWSFEGNVVFEGNPFTTPPLSGSVSYNLSQSSNVDQRNVGPTSNNFGDGSFHNTGFEGKLLFEAYIPLKIISVLVYAQGDADRTFYLYDENGFLMDEITVFLVSGQNRVTLDMEIPVAGKYSLGNVSENLYRHDRGVRYPYVVDNLISIYNSNADSDPQDYYYYFYDWQVQELPCQSPSLEVPVIVEPGAIAGFLTDAFDLTVNFTDISTVGASDILSWAWNFGDGSPLVFEQNPVHTYTEEGVYEIEFTIYNGSCYSTVRQTLEVEITSAAHQPEAASGLKIYPNPAVDEVTISFDQANSGQLQLNVTDATGSIALSRKLDSTATKVVINTSVLAAGTYQFQVIGQDGVSVRRVAIVK